MGLFDNVRVEEGVDLPHLPDSIDATEIGWQTKSFSNMMDTYKITADGRLTLKEQSYRDKTDEEKQAEAEKWGFDSWEAYTAVYDEYDVNEEGLVPDAVEGELTFDEDGDNDNPPTLLTREQILHDEWWADQNMHGSFQFYSSLKRDPIEYETREDLEGEVMTDDDGEPVEFPSAYALDVFVAYEARFTEGELDEIILVSRHDDREEVIEQLEEYDES